VSDLPGSFDPADADPGTPEVRPRPPGPSHGPRQVASGKVKPASVPADRLPALVERIKGDVSSDWPKETLENLGSYLSSLSELEGSETISAELILAEYERICRSKEAVEDPQFKDRLSHQDRAPRRSIDQQTPEPASGSILGRLSELVAGRLHGPRSLAHANKIVPKLPRQFGRYRLLEELGQGAMGTVYLARDTQLHRHVALKVPLTRSVDVDETHYRRILDRFYHEAHAAAILRHPNLCPVYDVGKIDGVPYLTMAYIKGLPLSRYIDRTRPPSPRWVAVLIRKLALALQAAHDKGVIHRDLKPSNVMICAGREPVIMDFGLAWRIDRRGGDERLTRTGIVLGTPAYMSPEQLSGKVEDLGPRCDVYSLGVILYELLTGRCPFDGPEAVVLAHVLFVEPGRPTDHRPGLDPRLEAICLKAMAKRDDERYATMTEMAAALSAYLRQSTTSKRSRSSAPKPNAPPPNHDRREEAAASREAEPSRGASEPGEPLTAQVGERPIAVLQPAGLLKSWRRWTATVASFATSRKSRRAIDQRAFTSLRNQLLATLQMLAAEAPEVERGFYRSLEQLVLPWVSALSLAREDREILRDLLTRCQHAEWILEYHSPVHPGGWLPAVSVVLAAASALLFWGLVLR
jgi:serine/threonine protein kinase